MSRARCTYSSWSLLLLLLLLLPGISIRILPGGVSVPFSTEPICERFQTPSSYVLSGAPEVSTLNRSRAAFHDSEITRKEWLVPPSLGRPLFSDSPKSCLVWITTWFELAFTGNRNDRCWSSPFG